MFRPKLHFPDALIIELEVKNLLLDVKKITVTHLDLYKRFSMYSRYGSIVVVDLFPLCETWLSFLLKQSLLLPN